MLESDVLRFAFSQGPGREFAAPLGPERPLTTSFGRLPAPAVTDRLHPLVWGSVDLLEDTAYPAVGADPALAPGPRLEHALVMAFGLQRREPANLFNDHRSCASVRSRFPVHPFVHTADEAWYLDVYRHGLLPLGEASLAPPADQPLWLALAGRFTHLPSLYGRLRGPLVELEMGMGLRSLWVGLEVFGLSGRLHLPGNDAALSARVLAPALRPASQWTAPLAVALDHPDPAPAGGSRDEGESIATRSREDDDSPDPTLDEAVAVHRTALATVAASAPDDVAGRGRAVPEDLAPAARSWAEVLWRRSAGHMPRQLPGFSGRRRRLPAVAVSDALAWVSLPPPTPLLQKVSELIEVSVCLQDVEGYDTGWYRRRGDDGAGRPALRLLRAEPSLPVRLEACYGHRLSVEAGCAVRHAAMTWVLSANVTALLERFGPGGWTLAQYACGWMVHGLCLSAAAHGCYARPSRAFDEVLLHPVVGTAPGEMVLLSVVCGAGRFVEAVLDLRT